MPTSNDKTNSENATIQATTQNGCSDSAARLKPTNSMKNFFAITRV